MTARAVVRTVALVGFSCGPCYRCGHVWIAPCECRVWMPHAEHVKKCAPPDRCARCKSRTWDEPEPRGAGRPKSKE